MYIRDTSYDDFKKQSGGDAEGGYAWGFIEGSADWNQSQYEQHQKEFEEKYMGKTRTSNSYSLLEKFGDSNVLSAWTTCKSECSKQGLHSWVEMEDADNMILKINWIPYAGASNPKVVTSTIEGAIVTHPPVTKGKIIADGSIIPNGITQVNLKRSNIHEPVIISLEIPGQDISEYVPKFIEAVCPTPPKKVEIITTAAYLDGRITGYVVNNDPNFPNLAVHDPSQPNGVPDNAGFYVDIPEAGSYRLEVQYATDVSRPTEVLVNQAKILDNRLESVTGGFRAENAQWFVEGSLPLQKGITAINFFRSAGGNIPHIKAFKLILEK